MPQRTPPRPKSPELHIACICTRGDEVIVGQISENGHDLWLFPEIAVRHSFPLIAEAQRCLAGFGQATFDISFIGAVDDLRLNPAGSVHTHRVYIVAAGTCDPTAITDLPSHFRFEEVSRLAALQTDTPDWSAAILAQYVRQQTRG